MSLGILYEVVYQCIYCIISGEGMAGALYWQDLITLMKETGFSTPHLVAGSHIVVQNPELQQKTGNLFVSPLKTYLI